MDDLIINGFRVFRGGPVLLEMPGKELWTVVPVPPKLSEEELLQPGNYEVEYRQDRAAARRARYYDSFEKACEAAKCGAPLTGGFAAEP